MSRNLAKIYLDNPSTTLAADDLLYSFKSPYGTTNDTGIKYSDLKAQIASAGSYPPVSVGASKTLASTDANTTQIVTSSTPVTIIIPPNASVAFNSGDRVYIYCAQSGTTPTNNLAVAPGAGVTILDPDGGTLNNIALHGMSMLLRSPATDFWYFIPINPVIFNRSMTFAAITATSAVIPTQALTDASSVTWDLSTQQNASLLMTSAIGATRALANPTNMVAGKYSTLIITQSSSGSNALTYGTAYKFPGGSKPILSTSANAVDILTFLSDGTLMYGVAQYAFS